MAKNYSRYFPLFISGLLLSLFVSSCKKDSINPSSSNSGALATIGLYEQVIDTVFRRVYIPISQVGTTKATYYSVFDTGSTGMTIDANGLIPASMITGNGITITGDSVTVNGITITSQHSVISFGEAGSETQEFGNLAYTTVTIGDQNGSVNTARIPIFLYYKIINKATGKAFPTHSNDVFGVGPGSSFANTNIQSPISYFKLGNNVTNGFKLAMLNNSAFSTNGTYTGGLLTIGLVPDDFSSSGFIMHQLNTSSQGVYSPDIAASITYNGKTFAATVLFDTGTPSNSILEDNSAKTTGNMPANSTVIISTGNGFKYTYKTTSAYNLTTVSKPSVSGDPRTIFGIDFFISNEFLLDYTNHRIGLKNN